VNAHHQKLQKRRVLQVLYKSTSSVSIPQLHLKWSTPFVFYHLSYIMLLIIQEVSGKTLTQIKSGTCVSFKKLHSGPISVLLQYCILLQIDTMSHMHTSA
jgi:hypothetical protein